MYFLKIKIKIMIKIIYKLIKKDIKKNDITINNKKKYIYKLNMKFMQFKLN